MLERLTTRLAWLFSLDKLLFRAILPTGFLLLFYSAVIDQFRNPALFMGAVTMITTPAVRTVTRNGNGKGKDK